MQTINLTVPAGTYFLGDPCYAIQNPENWSHLCDQASFFDNGFALLPNGVRVIALPTAYGDGEYRDQVGNEFPVDSGCIGLVPIDSCEFADEVEMRYCGSVVTFEGEVRVGCERGVLKFGEYIIDTNDY